MSFFKRKEKNLIPEAAPSSGSGGGGMSRGGGAPSSSGNSFGKGKKEQPDPEGFEKLPGRRYQRDAYNYQPGPRAPPQQQQQHPGGYGNYGNYGSQQQQQGYGQQQPPPIEGQGALSGAGGYGSSDARSNLFKGARAPNPNTGASFDGYAGAGAGSRGGSYGSYNTGTGRGAPQSSDYGGDGEGVLSGGGNEEGQEQTEEDDEV